MSEKRKIVAHIGDVLIKGDYISPEEKALEKKDDGPPSLAKSILNALNSGNEIQRLAFEVDPATNNQYRSLYAAKLRLIPDSVLKRIAIQDDLVAAIVMARQNQMANFGRPRPDRFSMGFIIEPNVGIVDNMSDVQKKELDERIERAVTKLTTCGDTKGWSDEHKMSFSQYISMSVRSAIVCGRLATEIIWVDTPEGEKRFHSFRPIDAGTIYRATPQQSAAESVRQSARHLLESIRGAKLEPERYEKDEYKWVQVIDARPIQAFTEKECVVHNFYPVPDVELEGYPVTPIDTIISAVTTHISITTYNKLYWQNGRSAKGMVVIRSDDIDEGTVQRIKQQFNASINNVNNSHRLPLIGVGKEDDVSWTPLDSSGGGKDMEFQYLCDLTSRIILSAFQMSPEELPGWSYLSRGTASQALSESNNEYKLEANRDMGIRPLVSQLEQFINSTIFPLIDPVLAKICTVKFKGLEADNAEKESIRLTQDAAIHLTFDQILDRVEKKPVGKAVGGNFPLNPAYGAVLDKYVTVGTILEVFFGIEGASKEPSLQYVRDPFWFQFQQMQMQAQQMQAQEQAAQAQQQAPHGNAYATAQPGSNQPAPNEQSPEAQQQSQGQPVLTEKQKSAQDSSASGQGAADVTDLTRSIDQAITLLSKSEQNLPASKRKLLAQQRKLVENFVKGFKEDSKEAINEILKIADTYSKTK